MAFVVVFSVSAVKLPEFDFTAASYLKFIAFQCLCECWSWLGAYIYIYIFTYNSCFYTESFVSLSYDGKSSLSRTKIILYCKCYFINVSHVIYKRTIPSTDEQNAMLFIVGLLKNKARRILMFSPVWKCATWHLKWSDVGPHKYGEEHPVEVTEAHHCSEQTCGHFRSQGLGLLHGYKSSSDRCQVTVWRAILHFEASGVI